MTSAYGAELTDLPIDRLNDQDYLETMIKEQDAIFFCHPNNPTGEIYNRIILESLLTICEENECYLILDEAFYDFSDEVYSMVSKIEDFNYLIILRSVTKMYSIAGIRLGMLFAEKELVDSLRAYQSYWSVNAISLKIGETVKL